MIIFILQKIFMIISGCPKKAPAGRGAGWVWGLGCCRGWSKVDLLEIQEFLPENHPDLIIKINPINEDLTYLINLFDKLNIK